MLKGFTIPIEHISVELISNYHTHNYLCGHAGGTVTDYVREAVKHGMKTIGISDHCLPPVDSYDPYFNAYNIDREYLPQFEEAEMLYGDKIRILRGVEIEYFEGHSDYYKLLTDKLDYMVLGQHLYMCDGSVYNSFIDGTDDRAVVAYFDSLCAAAKSGLFALIAHPDLIFYRNPKITQKMTAAFDRAVKCAVDNGVTLELNANGIRYHGFRYPTDLLVELCKKYNARVVVSSDAHNPAYICDKYTKALYAWAVNNGLNVVNEIIKL